jgi:CRISPR type III-B/RAMP module-associated protein Cmr5
MSARLDLDMARRAAAVVDTIIASGDAKQMREIRTRARDLPIMLRASGVAATVVFYASQAKAKSPGPAYKEVLSVLVDVAAPGQRADQPIQTIRSIADLDTAMLARRTRELETFAHWLKRLVEAHAAAAGTGPADA